MTSDAAVTVGIDIGTTSVKAVAVTDDGTVVARSRVPHRVVADADRLRHDAARAWHRGPLRAFRELQALRPRAVTVTGMVPSLAAVDRRGRPRSAGLLYGDAAGRRADRQGMPDLVGDAPEFLRALVHEVPDAAAYWPAQTTALVALGGSPALAQGVAQVLWPLVADGRWDVDAVTGCGARLDQLPALVADREPVAEVDGVVLDGGAIDVMCERLVSGVGDDDVLVICGSTLIVMARLPAGTALPPSILGFPDETGALTTSAASNAGALFLDWVDRTVGRARGVAEPADVPVWTPYIRGERTPWQDPARRAAVNDLHLGHGPAALRRGAFEASAFVVRHLLELMGVEPRRLVAVGGGTRSSGWMQALADVNRAPVDAATEPEGAAIGAAFLARVSAGLADDLADAKAWARPTRRFEPDPAWVRPADARYRRFRDLVDPSAPTTPAAG